MKKALKTTLKILAYLVGGIVVILIVSIAYMKTRSSMDASMQRKLLGEEVKMLTINEFTFRDLNKNGKLDIYEDKREPIESRLNDLVSLMTLEEKAGSMFITMAAMEDENVIETIPVSTDLMSVALTLATGTPLKMITEDKMNHFNLLQGLPPRLMTQWHNNIQKIAERTRLGIPLTIASDPRHYFSSNLFSMPSTGMSQWPEQLGFAAINDTILMKQFAEIAKQEYMAVGIRVALHPMADLATEPRWARISGTFGEDAEVSSRLLKPYILGFQNGDSLNAGGVACMTKHFSGGGPQKEGLDPHFSFQKGQVYPGKNFEYHLKPFEAAFEAKTASIMPYYGVPMGQTSENVGFSYNKDIITGLLREKYKYDGIVCTDWGLVTDKGTSFTKMSAMAWGVEKLNEEERVQKIIDAGCDILGGENRPELIIKLVKSGKITEERLNQSVKRLMRLKFVLGLFDNPFVDADKAEKNVGRPEWKALGEQAQRRSLTLLKNEGDVLPLQAKKFKIFIKGIAKEVAENYGTVVGSPEEADFAIIRANTPYVPVEDAGLIASMFHHGDLDFKGKEKEELLSICKKVPTIFTIFLDRPAVIPDINAVAKGVIGDYGASDAAVLDVIFGKAKPEGKLPFELPSSMEAVRNQKEDVPYDSKDPLYKFGFGLTYKR